jgi:hypothetical protein
LVAGISYCQWVPKLTLSSDLYLNGYGFITDISTGKAGYYDYNDNSNLTLYDLNNYSQIFSIPNGTYVGPVCILPDLDGNGIKEVILMGHDQNHDYLTIMDLSTHNIIKQWKDAQNDYSCEFTISNSNRILLDIVKNKKEISIYDLGESLPTSIIDKSKNVNSFSLGQNFPNPFNPETTIEYTISKPGISKIKIYDITGKLVNTIERNDIQPGTYHYHWNGLNSSGNKLASGTYIYELEADGIQIAKKMILLK